MTKQKTGFDFDALRYAVEQLDAEVLINLYSDGAKLRIVNRITPPSAPRELHGKEEITEYLRDVCGRAMTHRIENEVVGGERVAFNEACEYPDGTRVFCAASLLALRCFPTIFRTSATT